MWGSIVESVHETAGDIYDVVQGTDDSGKTSE
jgi:hypothetical protein